MNTIGDITTTGVAEGVGGAAICRLVELGGKMEEGEGEGEW
jgi:hypothetical protein